MVSPRKFIAPAVVFSLALGALAPAFAEHRGFDRMANKLGLSDEQVTAIQELQSDRGDQRESRRELREEIKQLIESDQVDAAATLAGEAASERIYRLAEKRAAMAGILTAEQLAQWDAMKQKRGKRGHGPGRRHHQEDQDVL